MRDINMTLSTREIVALILFIGLVVFGICYTMPAPRLEIYVTVEGLPKTWQVDTPHVSIIQPLPDIEEEK